MAKSINKVQFQGTAASGEFSKTIDKMRGALRQIIISPATATTTYDVLISDGSSQSVWEREAVVDELNELVEILVNSNLQVRITNATANEAFRVTLVVEE